MYKTRIDLTDKTFGKLKVLQCVGQYKGGNAKWECVCECGNKIFANKANLESGGVKSCKECSHPYKDYSGLKIEKLTVIERSEDKINKNGCPVIQWKCKCDCGEIVIRCSAHLKRGKCKCKNCKAIEDASRFGYMEIKQHHWYTIERQAKKRGFDFTITLEYVWDLFIKQDRKCALSGVPICFAKNKTGHSTGETTASLDRIDSSKGYVAGNVQWLYKWVNCMKYDFSQEEFIDLCRKITRYQDEK